MKAGRIIGKYKDKKGEEFLIRYLNFSDYEKCLNYINRLVEEDAMILLNKKLTKEEELEWICKQLKSMENNESLVLVAEKNGRIIGITEIIKRKGKESHIGVFGISVEKNFRGRGIGELLARKILEIAKKELKIKMVILGVYENNIPALNLYKKLGFNICGKLPKGIKHKRKYITKICMYKEL